MPLSNSLIHETSPYLLQHAYNPVHWYAWNEATLERAKKEDKLILISIGYSACHWCHVMEHESFENEEVAQLMNQHFINIKIDREERPDIDQVYMTAVQLMTGQGGWPLNCFALPDGRPIYGGTYFPKQQWMNVLGHLAHLFQNNRNKVEEYASELTEGIIKSEFIIPKESPIFNRELLDKTIQKWSSRFDNINGGPQKSPKFPLPNNYLFLLRYAHLTDHAAVMKHVNLSLQKMADGGIYDHIGGGFARYSVDERWKVPHFEKMLYDNAQLISLYAEAYRCCKNEKYKQVVIETLKFIENELSTPQSAFYSALDADSEGAEGKYYVWQKEELKEILKEKFQLFADYFNINEEGYWEEDNYILLKKNNDVEIALNFQLSLSELKQIIEQCKSELLNIRNKRKKPGLDDKCLTSWNALMIKAYCDAYLAIGEKKILERAIESTDFIIKQQLRKDGGLNHNYKNGQSTINGFLEDYSFFIEALISVYQCTGIERYLDLSFQLVNYTLLHFYDKNSGMFYFTNDTDLALIVRKTEISDNVIPASNSQMARNLWTLSKYYHNNQFRSIAEKMLGNVQEEMLHYGAGYSNWAILLLEMIIPSHEFAIVGKNVNEIFYQLQKYYFPNCIFALSKQNSSLPLLKNRYLEDKTLIYVCKNNTCQLPVESVKEALEQLNLLN